MGVTRGHRRRAVPEERADDRQAEAAGHQDRGEGVPQVVQPDVGGRPPSPVPPGRCRPGQAVVSVHLCASASARLLLCRSLPRPAWPRGRRQRPLAPACGLAVGRSSHAPSPRRRCCRRRCDPPRLASRFIRDARDDDFRRREMRVDCSYLRRTRHMRGPQVCARLGRDVSAHNAVPVMTLAASAVARRSGSSIRCA